MDLLAHLLKAFLWLFLDHLLFFLTSYRVIKDLRFYHHLPVLCIKLLKLLVLLNFSDKILVIQFHILIWMVLLKLLGLHKSLIALI